VQCAGQPVLPVGLKDEMGADTVKIFCPKCQCVYHPPPVRSRSSHHGGAGAAGVDGAAFGTTFPHLFLMTFSNLVPDPLPQDSAYIPRVFGFRVHMSERSCGPSPAPGHQSSSATRQQRESVDNNKRSFVGRRSEAAIKDNKSRDGAEPAAETSQDRVMQDATTATSNQKGRKGLTTSSSKQMKVSNDSNNNAGKEDVTNKKTKSGKRKSDIDAGNNNSKKQDVNGPAHNEMSASKRRRKSDN